MAIESDVLPGGEALRNEIDGLGLSITEWCEQKGLDRAQVSRAINGLMRLPSVEFAFDVWQATDGRIDWKLWVAPDDVRNERHEQRSAAARARHREARAARRATGTDGR